MKLIHLAMLFVLPLAQCSGFDEGFTTVFFDDFNRVDGQTLGHEWFISFDSPGVFQVTGGLAQPFSSANSGAGQAYRVASTDATDLRVSAKMIVSGGSFAHSFSLTAKGNGAALNQAYTCGNLNFSSTLFRIARIDGAEPLTFIDLASASAQTLPDNSETTISMTFKGDQITCEISGGTNFSLTATDSALTTGGHMGMIGGQDNNYFLFFDDYRIEKNLD